jgi:hypothetical protein
MCAAIAHPYPLHTLQQRRSHSHHASLHRRLCPARAQPATTLRAAPPLLCPVSCCLEPPSRPRAAKHLRRPKLHPRVEPLRHEEGSKPTNIVRFPCHGCPVADSPPSAAIHPSSSSVSSAPVPRSSATGPPMPTAAGLGARHRASLPERCHRGGLCTVSSQYHFLLKLATALPPCPSTSSCPFPAPACRDCPAAAGQAHSGGTPLSHS